MSDVICQETGKALSGEIFIAFRENDQNRFVTLSAEAVNAIPADKRSQERKNYKSGGFDISRARIGKSGSVQSHPEDDYAFSISAIDALDELPRTSKLFPCKVQPRKGENLRPPINMAVPIT
jgi:hypothetical protein